MVSQVAAFLFRPSQSAETAEAERTANEAKQAQKVVGTSTDKEMNR